VLRASDCDQTIVDDGSIVSQLVLITTHDFFYPLVDDPYLMGRIGAANVLSDLYAAGVTTPPHTSIMTLAVPLSRIVPESSRLALTSALVCGYRDGMSLAGVRITGGQTVLNPWPIIGGTVSALVPALSHFTPTRAQHGHRLLLTKPLGTQLIINAHEALQAYKACAMRRRRAAGNQTFVDHSHDANLREVREVREACHVCADEAVAAKWESWVVRKAGLSCEDVERAMDLAVCGMVRLNKEAAIRMVASGASACTDVTGFGIRGHAENLAKVQTECVQFVIERLPIWMGAVALDAAADNRFGLLGGTSAETSGGLLIAMPPENVERFCRDLSEAECGWGVWDVGRVERSEAERGRGVQMMPSDELEIIEIGRPVSSGQRAGRVGGTHSTEGTGIS